jgi:hypothetical protein
MASIIRAAIIEAPAAKCWEAVMDFGALHERLARGFVTDTVMLSDRDRRVTFANGAVAVERLVGVDVERMRLAYGVVDSPLGTEHYNASVQIMPLGAAQCRFVWTVDLLPDELAGRVGELMDAGLKAMADTLADD